MPGTDLKKDGPATLVDAKFVVGLLVLASLSFYVGAIAMASSPVPADTIVEPAPPALTAPLPYFLEDSLTRYFTFHGAILGRVWWLISCLVLQRDKLVHHASLAGSFEFLS
jgi:hypothetical protein